ncbi:MAG: twin-arginine translocase subunit TatB [Alphaproteobacteria bacterium]|nr:twin-arginine translocase subunit TatB [Alphaproteobacteria bacterium]
MFDIGSTELLLIAVVAIIVIGPKDLPRALYKVGQIMGKARGMARHFRTGIDTMIREAELEDMEKKWAAENERIMQQWPTDEGATEPSGALVEPLADKGVPSSAEDDVSEQSVPEAKDGSAV